MHSCIGIYASVPPWGTGRGLCYRGSLFLQLVLVGIESLVVILPSDAGRAVPLVAADVDLGALLQVQSGPMIHRSFLGVAIIKALVVRDTVEDGCFNVPEDYLGWVGAQDVLLGLVSRELGCPSANPDTHTSRGNQGQGFGGQRCSGGWLCVWEDCSRVPGIFVGLFLLTNLLPFAKLSVLNSHYITNISS